MNRRSYLTATAGAALAGVGVSFAGAGTAAGSSDGAGGPVVLMGIDAEDGGIGGHGPIEVYADVVDSVLEAVTNGGQGILVVGESGMPNTVFQFWQEIRLLTGEPVSYVGGADDIETVDFDGYAMLAVVSSEYEMFQTGPGVPAGEGLTEAENEAFTARVAEVADHVNAGGGLLGFSQSGLSSQFGYLADIGDFETQGGLGYNTIEPTDEGAEIGITTDLNVCCWHDLFLAFPDFLDVLAYNPSGDAAAIGGVQVVVPTVSVAIDGADETYVGTAEEYDLTVTNTGDPTPEETSVDLAITRTAGIEDGDVSLEADDEGAWSGLSLSADGDALTVALAEDVALPNGFEETTPLRAAFAELDTYTLEATVVGVDTGTVYARTSHDVDVLEPPIVEQCVDLLAGQHIEAGSVCVVNDGEHLTVTYATDDGWEITETHLAVGASFDTFDAEGWTNRPGNPRPGRFPHGDSYDGTEETTYTVSLEDVGVEPGDEVVIAAHAALERDDGTESESAWGAGERFVQRGNWATHFGYEIQ
ncbi:hypothetical protein GCM10025298_02340 [Natronobiforma cellulositropha]